MDHKELIERSPLRTLDRRLQGGLGPGNLGIVIARHGAGKTPFLVGVALDHLLRGERVLHVSLDQKVDHVREFYEQIFEEQVRRVRLEDLPRVHREMERGRRIHTYLGNSFTVDKLRTAVEFMKEHADFQPSLIVLDGCDLARLQHDDLAGIVEVARLAGAELWMSAVRHRGAPTTDEGLPEPVGQFQDLARVIVDLQTQDGSVLVKLLKPAEAAGEELPFVLDPTTMLVKGK